MSNVQLAKDIYAAFGRGDIPTVLAGFHPEIEWREAEGNPYKPDGAARVGPQAVLENLFMRIGSEWDGFTVTVRTLHDAGEHVVMEGRYTGLYKPSGKSVDAQVCHVLRFPGGKLSSFQQYVDTDSCKPSWRRVDRSFVFRRSRDRREGKCGAPRCSGQAI